MERNDTADNLTWVLAAGLDAFQAWDDPSTDRLILAYLLEESATHDLYLGEFNIALTHAQESLRIRLSILPPDDEEVLNDYNTLAIVYGSRGDYDRGLNYLGRAEGILKEDPGMFPLKSILLNTNYGRNLYLMGNFSEAERRLDLAWAELRGLDNWAWNGQ